MMNINVQNQIKEIKREKAKDDPNTSNLSADGWYAMNQEI